MIKVTSKLTINTNCLKKLSQASVKSLELTAEALHTEVVQAEVIPRMDGDLQGKKFYVDPSKSHPGKVKLVFEGPYARRLYFHPEYNFHRSSWRTPDGKQHDGNPNAKGRWLEDWLPGGKYQDFVRNTYAKLLKKNGGL